MVKTLCADSSTTDDVRKMENDPLGLPGEFWNQMKETGLLAMRLPEEHGGMGLTLLDCAVIFEELGRGLASGPIFESAVMAVTAISKAGTDAQKSLLESLGAGDTIITPAWLEPDNGFGPQGVQMRAAVTPEGYRLNGVKRHVFYGQGGRQVPGAGADRGRHGGPGSSAGGPGRAGCGARAAALHGIGHPVQSDLCRRGRSRRQPRGGGTRRLEDLE